MSQPKIDIFEYEDEIGKLPEEWMVDMATVFREFDSNKIGKIPSQVTNHIFTLFRLPSKGLWKEDEIVTLDEFLAQAAIKRDEIFLDPKKRYMYYFKMISSLGGKTIDAVDIQRLMSICGDNIDIKYCDDFIDEFDRKSLSKDSITPEEFCDFCTQRKIPV